MAQGHTDDDHGFPSGGVFASALDAVIVMGADGLIRDWNPAAEDVFGLRREEAVGRELAELIIPGELRDSHRNALRRYLDTREPTLLDRRVELSGMRSDGRRFPLELTITQMADAEPPLFVGFIRDLGELGDARRENDRLQQRMAFLAQAGLVLETSLDLDATLRRLVELLVPELAELAVIDVLENDRQIRTAVAAGEDPQAAARLEAMRRKEPLRLTGSHPVADVLRSGKSTLLESMSSDFRSAIAQGPEHRALMHDLHYRSAIVVPLRARGRVLGALSLLRMSEGRAFDRDDLVLAEELARRAALAMDNARLFESTRHLARTLQASLLPHAMPEVPGLRISGLYRAAAQGQEVGGDFYDVFAMGESRWGIAIGDVCGKGAEAAALTSLARYTIRALAGQDPGTVLQMLGEAVMRDPELLPERFLTALFVIAGWDDDTLVIELACAGHPPPIVRRREGQIERVRARGPLIGMIPTPRYEVERVALVPGDSVVLYTDGLTDARAPVKMLTEADLGELIAQRPDLSGEELAAYLEHAVTGGEDPRDDIAVLVIDVLGSGVSRPAADAGGVVSAAR